MKNSNDTIRNCTRNLPACSTVPQQTALPYAPLPRFTNRCKLNTAQSFPACSTVPQQTALPYAPLPRFTNRCKLNTAQSLFLSELEKIWYRKCSHKFTEWLRILQKLAWSKSYFTNGHKLNSISFLFMAREPP